MACALHPVSSSATGTNSTRPCARLDGVRLEPMAPAGIEIIVGVIRDELFGPVLMVGAGGVATELFKDVAYRLAPVDRRGALEMLASLRIKTLLEGARGAKRADIAALARLIARISAFAVACRESVREIELNPVIVHAAPGGYSVVDALIVLEPSLPSEA